ncbi:MAG: response regulator, partial [Oscillochloris sp.]|nr:response regulator [Oscillochloris sp.]
APMLRHHEGTGLGLALVRRLAELHGGSITVESEVDKGSRFTITLPYQATDIVAVQHQHTGGATSVQTIGLSDNLGYSAIPRRIPPDEQVRIPQPEQGSRNVRLLFAEDNMVNVIVISEYLEARGYQVLTVHNGREVLTRVVEERPDVILMDIQMPEMDGLEAMRHLRAWSDFATIPIIALTALAMPGDRERCLAAGASAYLTKPVSLHRLVELIERLLHERRISEQP